MNNAIIIIIATVLAFAITALLGFVAVPMLHKLKYGQTILDIGPKWHKNKEGTPTMGGIMFIIGIVFSIIATLVIAMVFAPTLIENEISSKYGHYKIVSMVAGVILAICTGLIGFIDDFIKVVKKRNLGLTAKQKTVMQMIVSAGYLYSLYLGGMTYTRIPFIGTVNIDRGIGLLFWPIALIFIYGFTNAVNLTDGIDGLATSVTTVVACFFIVVSVALGFNGLNSVLCDVCAAALAGGCIGFLLWNMHPAKIFMGDTGSMFLGGMVVALSFMIEAPIVLIFAGVLYFIEALSVVIQVAYFKKTGGKRLFKMTPIHHHFELSNWSENKIVLVFSLVAFIGCSIAYLLLLYI